MKERSLETRRGVKTRLLEAGAGRPLLYLHGAGGLFPEEPLLERLAVTQRVLAPEWPGYGVSSGDEQLEDMLDFSLHAWDVVEALDLGEPPDVVAHSMGGMIAAEMACLAPYGLRRLALLAPAGLWLDSHPIPDLFAMLPFEMARVLFRDPRQGETFFTRGVDFSNLEALQEFLVANARRLGMAGKILFPIPNRRLSKRLYRQTAPTLLVWGESDAFIPPVYAEHWLELLPAARRVLVPDAGHMLPYEQPEAVARLVAEFLA